MPEHFHLLLRPCETGEVTAFLRRLKSRFARMVLTRWRQLDAPILDRLRDAGGRTRFWQPGGGYDRNIVSQRELRQKIDYMHANPVRRGLVDRPVDWAWSSARWYAGEHDGPVKIDPLP